MAKSSAELLLAFSKDYLSGEGNLIRHMAALGYTVAHVQIFLGKSHLTLFPEKMMSGWFVSESALRRLSFTGTNERQMSSTSGSAAWRVTCGMACASPASSILCTR